jgi:hypothetical protein
MATNSIHHEFAACGLARSGTPLDGYIGRRGRHVEPLRAGLGSIHSEPFTVQAVQCDYAGRLVLRVIADGDERQFGYPIKVDDCVFDADAS